MKYDQLIDMDFVFCELEEKEEELVQALDALDGGWFSLVSFMYRRYFSQ